MTCLQCGGATCSHPDSQSTVICPECHVKSRLSDKKGDNEMELGTMHSSSDIYLVVKENPTELQLGDHLHVVRTDIASNGVPPFPPNGNGVIIVFHNDQRRTYSLLGLCQSLINTKLSLTAHIIFEEKYSCLGSNMSMVWFPLYLMTNNVANYSHPGKLCHYLKKSHAWSGTGSGQHITLENSSPARA